MRRRLLRRAARLTTTAVLIGVCTTSCSSGSDPSPSTGVDELVIPTPSPDPADFVAEVDNPWFVLDDAAYADATASRVERTVSAGPAVAGVPTTAVTFGDTTDLYAQDIRGNVWWFGREGEWMAGTDGAEAGLAMPAEPRRGDGFRRALVPGAELRAEVLAVDDTSVVLETVTGSETTLESFTRDVGLETVETLEGAVVLARQEEGE